MLLKKSVIEKLITNQHYAAKNIFEASSAAQQPIKNRIHVYIFERITYFNGCRGS